MLPQCDPAILSDNPQFKILHQQLITTILNPDGSTRALEADPQRRQAKAELKEYQIRTIKRRILKRIVCQLPYDLKTDLPDELRDLVAITALYLDDPTPPRVNGGGRGSESQSSDGANDNADDDILSLLEPDLNTFRSQLIKLLPSIRNALTADLAHLRTLLNATTTTLTQTSNNSDQSKIPQHAQKPNSRLRPLSIKPTLSSTSSSSLTAASTQPLLSTHLSNRQHALRTLQSVELTAARRLLSNTAAEVLSAHTQLMERMIQVLERTKYGSLARAGKARAEYLAAVSKGLDGKIKIMQRDIISSIYTRETIDALHNYRKHLHDTRMQLEERRRKAMQELEGYDDTGTNRAGAMTDIAKRYGSLVKEVESVRMETRQLGGNM